jgi:23S rRNA pseudouridine1911/1915/1917 synthase
MELLYEDRQLVVCRKPVGVISQADGQADLVSLLREQLGGEIYPIHRLDRNVGGVMVFARTKPAAARLSTAVQQRTLEKEYLCVVHGCPDPAEGELRDLLFKDSGKNKTFVVKRPRKGVKEAVLDYRVLATVRRDEKPYSLVHVHLQTGRTHQVRVQFSSRGWPLVGDGKYGGKDNGVELGLWSCRLTIPMPKGAPLTVCDRPPETTPWNWFDDNVYAQL